MARLSAIKEALDQSPDNVSLLLLYGNACLDELCLEDARDSFAKVLQLLADQSEAQLGLARVLLMEGDLSGAAVRVERVIQGDANHVGAHLLYSRILLAEGNRAKALDCFERAVQIDPTASDAALEQSLGNAAADSRRNSASQGLPTANDGTFNDNYTAQDLTSDLPMLDLPFDDTTNDWQPEIHFAPGDPERRRINFSSVGGMEELKEEIRLKIVYPLQHPDLFKAYGRKAGGGLLIFGPPGCGKSLMLRAVAGEVGCSYFAVGLHEIFDPYFGSSERNLHQVFETARQHAPCVLVFDEFDALAADRRNLRESQMRNLVNQFLFEMDGLRSDTSRVLVLGATNAPWQIDPAFRRPGRFDQTIFVPPPDNAGRAQIIELLARDKPMLNLNADELARQTRGFTGADLRWVFERAADIALSEAVHTGNPVPITMNVLVEVARHHCPSTQEWLDGARSHVQQQPQDSLYAEMKKFLGPMPAPDRRTKG
ncbi:MAG: AAA family ATPase [Verrucomicrobiaceae bacterium]|nr:AAA family ATPase [Verrucomicrobiaceae bacterium]